MKQHISETIKDIDEEKTQRLMGPKMAEAGREGAIRSLLEEVMRWHSDPTLSDYNGCDKGPCLWCECAKGLLDGTMTADAVVRNIGCPF